MSREVAVSAPGKTILMGEHAAVYEHPALVASVDLRLTVTARSGPSSSVRLAMPSIGWSGERSWDDVAVLSNDPAAPLPEPQDLAFVAVGQAARHADSERESGLELTIVSDIPPGSGLGSSAALAVGVVAATLAALGRPYGPGVVSRLALEVETRQHGRPSGVDVQAVLHGGVLWCRRNEARALECSRVALDPARLGAFLLFHAGTPGETTGEMVAAVKQLAEIEPARVHEAMDAIEGATRETLSVLTDPPSREIALRLIPHVRRAEAALESLGVVPAEVARAIRAIEAAGGAAKISGAGGIREGAGLVLVVPPDPAWNAAGAIPATWKRLPVALGVEGLREEVAA